MFSKFDKLALFIDGKNLYDSANALGFSVDYKAMLESFNGRGRISDAMYFTTCADENEHDPRRKTLDWMSYNGFTVVSRTRSPEATPQELHRLASELNMCLTLSAIERATHIDHAVIFSGNGLFTPLVTTLKRCGCRVTVISTIKTPSPFISDALRREASNFVELDDLREVFGRDIHQSAA